MAQKHCSAYNADCTVVHNKVKNVEGRLTVVDTDLAVLQGSTSKHSTAWTKVQNALSKRVGLVESTLVLTPYGGEMNAVKLHVGKVES